MSEDRFAGALAARRGKREARIAAGSRGQVL